jgi:hypothetical protein
MDYPDAKMNVGTLIERTNAAESKAEKAERELAEAEKVIQGIIDGCVHPDGACGPLWCHLRRCESGSKRRRAAK